MKVSRQYLISGSVLIAALGVLGSFQACSPGFSVIMPNVSNNGSGGSAGPANGFTVSYTIPTASFETFSSSGFNEFSDKTTSTNFWDYVPRYPLYSYGSQKRRWLYLPPNAQINNANPDAWIFPKGTVLWKLFSLNGRKVETRMLEKMGDGSGFANWRASVYMWRADQSEADLLKNNTFYSLTSAEKLVYEAGKIEATYRAAMPNQCVTCHQNATDGSLGFNYFQLSSRTNPRNVILLSQSGVLTNKVSNFDEILGNDLQRAAIGYLQGNCAHCHNGSGPGPHDFKHRSSVFSANDEPVLLSGLMSVGLITRGSKETSRLYLRPAAGTMPPQTISADPSGYTAIGAWIDQLQ